MGNIENVVMILTFCILVSVYQISASEDQTRIAGSFGQSVTLAAIRAIQTRCLFSNDHQMLFRFAAMASRFGHNLQVNQSNIGIWNMSELAFNNTKSPSLFHGTILYRQLIDRIRSEFQIDYENMQWRDGVLQAPLIGALAQRLLIESTVNGSVPVSFADQAKIWNQIHEADAQNMPVSTGCFLNCPRMSGTELAQFASPDKPRRTSIWQILLLLTVMSVC